MIRNRWRALIIENNFKRSLAENARRKEEIVRWPIVVQNINSSMLLVLKRQSRLDTLFSMLALFVETMITVRIGTNNALFFFTAFSYLCIWVSLLGDKENDGDDAGSKSAPVAQKNIGGKSLTKNQRRRDGSGGMESRKSRNRQKRQPSLMDLTVFVWLGKIESRLKFYLKCDLLSYFWDNFVF